MRLGHKVMLVLGPRGPWPQPAMEEAEAALAPSSLQFSVVLVKTESKLTQDCRPAAI